MKNLKFSLITPEHNPGNIVFLLELYDSICQQTYENWEWVLYLNNQCIPANIPDIIKNNPKVKLFRTEEKNSNIGAIKKLAFACGTGDVLVEVDHDDILIPDCLEKLNAAYQDDETGFVYSDSAVLHMEDKFIPYNGSYGWNFRMFDWKDKQLYAMSSFRPTSQSIGFIWYAPDHVRSWRTSVYIELGGHNPELSICDDHELCIRTYLKTKMVHIPEVLYIYRITGDNTWLERSDAIQIKTVELQRQYARELAERDADLKSLFARLDAAFNATIVAINRLTPTIIEVVVKAPLAAEKFYPGQFYRVQNYEAFAPTVEGTVLAAEGLALTGAEVDKEKGTISLIALEMGSSSRLCATWKVGDPLVIMGVTGTPTDIPSNQTVLLIGGGLGNANHPRSGDVAIGFAGSNSPIE